MPPRNATNLPRYGVREWYGIPIENVSREDRIRLAAIGAGKGADMPCPFQQQIHPGEKCSKKGGVCSLVNYHQARESVVAHGKTVTICPQRFHQDNTIFKATAKAILGTERAQVVREVPFLSNMTKAVEYDQEPHPDLVPAQGTLGMDMPVAKPIEEGDEEGKAVGRIDIILQSLDDPHDWCALEIQAVYFSGDGMGTHLAQFAAEGQSLPFPDKIRRPDFRSSGPKRLMPQLLVKVPALRRWGKKMAVIVDRPFIDNIGDMRDRAQTDISNCDIVWVVVDYDAQHKLYVAEIILTQLDQAVEALTAGKPVPKSEFERRIKEAIKTDAARNPAARNGKAPKAKTFIV